MTSQQKPQDYLNELFSSKLSQQKLTGKNPQLKIQELGKNNEFGGPLKQVAIKKKQEHKNNIGNAQSLQGQENKKMPLALNDCPLLKGILKGKIIFQKKNTFVQELTEIELHNDKKASNENKSQITTKTKNIRLSLAIILQQSTKNLEKFKNLIHSKQQIPDFLTTLCQMKIVNWCVQQCICVSLAENLFKFSEILMVIENCLNKLHPKKKNSQFFKLFARDKLCAYLTNVQQMMEKKTIFFNLVTMTVKPLLNDYLKELEIQARTNQKAIKEVLNCFKQLISIKSQQIHFRKQLDQQSAERQGVTHQYSLFLDEQKILSDVHILKKNTRTIDVQLKSQHENLQKIFLFNEIQQHLPQYHKQMQQLIGEAFRLEYLIRIRKTNYMEIQNLSKNILLRSIFIKFIHEQKHRYTNPEQSLYDCLSIFKNLRQILRSTPVKRIQYLNLLSEASYKQLCSEITTKKELNKIFEIKHQMTTLLSGYLNILKHSQKFEKAQKVKAGLQLLKIFGNESEIFVSELENVEDQKLTGYIKKLLMVIQKFRMGEEQTYQEQI